MDGSAFLNLKQKRIHTHTHTHTASEFDALTNVNTVQGAAHGAGVELLGVRAPFFLLIIESS